MQIPICDHGGCDERVWAASVDGVFRVRDAYKLAFEAQNTMPSSSNPDHIWTYLWKLNIPPKAKIFLWRALWDILPNGTNLKRKGIPNVESCQRCGGLETSSHVFKDCHWVRKVWEQSMNTNDIPPVQSFRDWFGSVMDNKNQHESEFFGVYAWQIWSARNELLFDKVYIAPELCYKRAFDTLKDYQKANEIQPGTENKRAGARWVPPPRDFIKINVDAAINKQADRIGLGLTVRDSDGAVLLSAAKSSWPVVEVERAEIEGFKWAADFVKDRNWCKVIVEGDAQIVVKALQGFLTRNLHNQVLIDNVRNQMSEIADHSISFCFREANNVAHKLAKWAAANVCSRVWLNEYPSWISKYVIADISH